MEFGIIVSKLDAAGLNIAKQLEILGLPKEFSMHFIEKDQVFADEVNLIKEDFIIFASKHKAASGIPTLTCHAIGNWGKADCGGLEKTLVPTSAFLLRNYLAGLQKKKIEKNLPFEVALECTHHGPLLQKPTVFIELGSSELQWKNETAAEAIAETIINCTNLSAGTNAIPVIGIGGTHYCSKFSKLVLRKNFAFSHICPEHSLKFFDEKMLEQAIDCSLEKPQKIVLDWKGLGKEKARILDLLSKQSLPVERVQKLLK